ncbi:MAG TPA: SCO family protein [Propionibacteriaceae bacterium]|nr:SCO family protein [Propionibacteriaceae bacterium]
MRRRSLLTSAAALAFLAGCASPGPDRPAIVSSRNPTGPYRGDELDPARSYDLPDVTLTDTSGAPYNLRTGAAPGQTVTALFFGYSNCPDVCTGILADMATARNKMPADLKQRLRLVCITTDPARDTAPVLKTYLDRIDPDFVGLTGDLATIISTGRSVGVDIADGEKLASGGYEVEHGTQVIGFGKDLRAAVVWLAPTAVDDLSADFVTLARA